MAVGGAAFAQQPGAVQPGPRVKGPRVWLDLDQAELDAAYDQTIWATNRDQLVRRYATQSDLVRARLGAPRRFSYGATPVEGLDVYATKRADAPINVFMHGGAWRAGFAKNYAFAAELFVRAGAHLVIPDFAAVQDVGGSLMPMADQVRRAVAWVYTAMPAASTAIPSACTSRAIPRARIWPASCSRPIGLAISTCRPTS